MICETLKVFKTFRVCVPGEIIQTGGDTADEGVARRGHR